MKATYKVNMIPMKIPVTFFSTRTEKNNPIFAKIHKMFPKSQTILRKHTKLGLSHYFTSKSITRLLCGTGIKSHLHLLEQNREPRLSPCTYGQLVLDENAKVINGAGKTCSSHAEE
jgi:hypothetical protein